MTPPLVYVDCDVPEGMTLEEFRASQRAEHEPPTSRLARLLARLRRS